jgi:hypothetical protein
MTMKRRDFLRAALGVVIVGGFAPEVLAQVARIPPAGKPGNYDNFIKDYLYKVRIPGSAALPGRSSSFSK